MRILIVENEKPAADRIVRLLKKLDNTVIITGIIETVEGTINWIQNNESPDLILMDIQLDDGLCFEIFETINVETPVIFTTAYDEYTLKAFKVNSVDYLLKPVDEIQLDAALKKFNKIYAETNKTPDYQQIIKELTRQYKSRFLIKIGEKYKSVPAVDISHFHILERSVFIKDFSGREYSVDYSLEHLENVLDPNIFFRINRDYIVNINSIVTIYSYSSSRLQLTLKNEEKDDKCVVSREKVREFKKWVDR
jgi:DNA-binding LytR/AlgR family response regulator